MEKKTGKISHLPHPSFHLKFKDTLDQWRSQKFSMEGDRVEAL